MTLCQLTSLLRLGTLCLACIALAGCEPQSIFHTYSASGDETTSVLVDANQRAIIAAPGSKTTGDNLDSRDVIVCAEPSPDTLSAVSGLLSLSADKGVFDSGPDEASATALFKAVTEQLGPRNATIQLLRDGLYRQCEAYLNGVLSSEDYETLANRYVDGMVTLLAIERITPDPNARSSNMEDMNSDGVHEILESMNLTRVETALEEKQTLNDTTGAHSGRADGPVDHVVNQHPPGNRARPEPGNVIEAVSKLTNAFLRKNLLDKCIKEHVEESAEKETANRSVGDTEAFKAAMSWMKEYDERLSNVADSYISELRKANDDVTRDVYRDLIRNNLALQHQNAFRMSAAMDAFSGVRPELRISNRLCDFLMRSLYFDEQRGYVPSPFAPMGYGVTLLH